MIRKIYLWKMVLSGYSFETNFEKVNNWFIDINYNELGGRYLKLIEIYRGNLGFPMGFLIFFFFFENRIKRKIIKIFVFF